MELGQCDYELRIEGVVYYSNQPGLLILQTRFNLESLVA